MQHTSPGAAIVAPIQSLSNPTQQVFVRDEAALVERPEQHVTGIVSVLAGKDQPQLRLWSKAIDATEVTPQWHRLIQSENTEAGFFERLGVGEAFSAIMRLSRSQTSLIPFNPITLGQNKALEKFWLEWHAVRTIKDPITLELALVPHTPRSTAPPDPTALLANARAQGKTIIWNIPPRNARGKLSSPNLTSLLSQGQLENPDAQHMALLIHVVDIDTPITVKSTAPEDGTTEPLTLQLVARRFTLNSQPVVKFWFDYLPALASAAPHTAFIRAAAWQFSNDINDEKTTPLSKLPHAQLYLEKPTPQGPSQPHTLRDTPENAIIDVFTSPQAWPLADQLAQAIMQNAKNQPNKTPSASFQTGDLSWLLSGLTYADAPDLKPEDPPYKHYDPVAFYLPLPTHFSQKDIQALSDRIHGTPATLSLLNNPASYSSSESQNYATRYQAHALFQYELARMQQISANQQPAAALIFTPLAVTPATSADQAALQQPQQHQQHQQAQQKTAAPPELRAWIQVPFIRQSASRKRALANEPIGMHLSITPHLDIENNQATHPTATLEAWSWRSFNNKQQETLNIDISSLLAQLRAAPNWQAGHGLRIAAQPRRNLHYPLLNWAASQLFVHSPSSAFNQRVTFSARSQLFQTLEMLQPLMRGSISDALLEASLFYAEQPPFFGLSRQRFPESAKRPSPRFSRISHPSSISAGEIVQPNGCSSLAPDSPQCANEYYAGHPRYRHNTAHCHAQHLILISDGNAPVNHSQPVAATLTEMPFCHRDSLSQAEQCGRSLARWLSSNPKPVAGTTAKKPKVHIHTLAFGTRDTHTQRYLYDLAEQGKGLYGSAKNAEEITDFLNRVVALSESQVTDLKPCSPH